MSKKTYIVDTNVLMNDASSLFSFEDNDVIIPMIVLEELDRHKGRSDEAGKNVRQVVRSLDGLREKGSLTKGVTLENGGTLRVASMADVTTDELKSAGLQADKPDNMIIAFARSMQGHAILVSKDINVRVKCDSLGVKCEDYLKMRAADSQQKFYRGVDVLEVPEGFIDEFYRNEKLDVPQEHLNEKKLRLFPNQIIIIKSIVDGRTIKSAIAKCVGSPGSLRPIVKFESAFGLRPRNKEQSFSLDLLFDPNIKLITLTGPAGTGKTILALAAALEQIKGVGTSSLARYDKLIVTRPVQPVGKDIGFLPGTLEEKLEPWIAPVRDNLNFLFDANTSRSRSRRPRKNVEGKASDDVYLGLMQDRGVIEIEAITFIRGRSIPNALLLVDEAQNLSQHELKTILTRVGDGTKVILTGDIEQIDNMNVDVYTNGLSYAVERFKDHPIAGHVTLCKGERSELATLASQIL